MDRFGRAHDRGRAMEVDEGGCPSGSQGGPSGGSGGVHPGTKPRPPETPTKCLGLVTPATTVVQGVTRTEFKAAEGQVASLGLDVKALKREMRSVNSLIAEIWAATYEQGDNIKKLLERLSLPQVA